MILHHSAITSPKTIGALATLTAFHCGTLPQYTTAVQYRDSTVAMLPLATVHPPSVPGGRGRISIRFGYAICHWHTTRLPHTPCHLSASAGLCWGPTQGSPARPWGLVLRTCSVRSHRCRVAGPPSRCAVATTPWSLCRGVGDQAPQGSKPALWRSSSTLLVGPFLLTCCFAESLALRHCQGCAYPQGGGRGDLAEPPPPPPRPNHPLTQNQKNWPLGKNEILNREIKIRGPF